MSIPQQTTVGFDAKINKSHSVKLGIILGVISFALGIIVLLVTRNVTSFLVLTTLSFGINTIVYILISLAFSYNLRKKNGGSWNFSIALKSIFLMLLLSTVIATVGTSIYVHKINPSLQEEVLRNTINVTIENMEANNASDEEIDSRVALLEEQVDALGKIKLTDALKGVLIAIIAQFIFSLLLAALTRNEKLVAPVANPKAQ